MTKGRKPSLATARKNLAGPKGKPPKCPPKLDAGAKGEWRRLAPELIASGRLTSADVQPFANYCQAVSWHADASARIAAEGPMITGAKGLVRNPLCAWALQLQAEIRQAADRFGLTPSARARVESAPPSEEIDSFEEFQKGGTRGEDPVGENEIG